MTPRNTFGLAMGALLVLLSACATATPYQAERSGYGYTAPIVEDGTYKVKFRGNANTSRSLVEDYLLLRMAELTLAEGQTHFIVQEQGTGCFITVRTSPNSECTIHKPHTAVYPYYSLEREPRWFWQSRTKNEYEAVAFFIMTEGAASQDATHRYVAREVLDRLSHLKN